MTEMTQLRERIERALTVRDMVGAEPLLSELVDSVPDDADAIIALAFVRTALRRNLDSIALLRKASADFPEKGDIRTALFESLLQEHDIAEALKLIGEMPDEERSTLRMRWHEADLLGKLGRHDEAIAIYDDLVRQYPDEAELKLATAYALKTVGRTQDAITLLRELTHDPRQGRAWWLLSDLKRFEFTADDIDRMSEALAANPPAESAIPIHFALGKALGDAGKFGEAFEQYRIGNRLKADDGSPSWDAVEDVTTRAIETYSATFMNERKDCGTASNEPIFVIGLHRSGSTLVEQILSSHSKVEGIGELQILPQVIREILSETRSRGGDLLNRVPNIPCEDFARYGQLYLDRAAEHRQTDRPYFVDKLPNNWRRLGLIRLLFPNAKIIDARRHPMAVGWSNFTQNFGHSGPSTRDLAAFGRFYRNYLRMMSHFQEVAPDAIHRVINEHLIEDFEPGVRSLLDFLGLEFEEQCLEFYRTRRAVPTPSAEQVRQPINREGMDRWKAYEPWLGDLKMALGDAIDRWDH